MVAPAKVGFFGREIRTIPERLVTNFFMHLKNRLQSREEISEIRFNATPAYTQAKCYLIVRDLKVASVGGRMMV
jgi:hypothetical protein